MTMLPKHDASRVHPVSLHQIGAIWSIDMNIRWKWTARCYSRRYRKEKRKKKRERETLILYYPDLFYTWTNKHYRRVSSGGNECARSSRRGAGLTSSSLGGGLEPDGPQGHAVVTQKRKLRTPVWARLRNIHISNPLTTPAPFVPSHDVPRHLFLRLFFIPFFFLFLLASLPADFPAVRIRAVDALCRALCRTIGSRSCISRGILFSRIIVGNRGDERQILNFTHVIKYIYIFLLKFGEKLYRYFHYLTVKIYSIFFQYFILHDV